MAIIELSMVTSTIVAMGVETTWEKARRHEMILKLLKLFKLDPKNPPADFDGIYAYTLIEYGPGKPEPIINFFRCEFVREAFRQSFYKNDSSILYREAESIIEWNKETGRLGRIEYDPRCEFAAFSAIFLEIVNRTRLPAEVRHEQKLDNLHKKAGEIIERLDRLEALGEIREELAQLRLAQTQTLNTDLMIQSPSEPVDIHGLLEAMGYRITDEKATAANLYFLCDMKWGAEILQEVVLFINREPTASDIASLNDAVVSYSASRGILLTRQVLSAPLCDLVHQRQHIQYYTLDEFTNRLANFGFYLRQLIDEYEASEMPRVYVPLTVKSEIDKEQVPQVFEPLQSFVDSWLIEAGRNHVSILGDFGSGKTWFCKHYAYVTAKRYLADPVHNRIPILITLRDYSRAYDVEQLITDAVANRFKVSLAAGYKTFARLNEAGRLLLIFDGFDEMERRVSDYRTKVDNFWELAKVAGPASKVLLTCRTAYFRHRSEEEEILVPRRGRVSLAAGSQMIDLQDRKGFEVMHLLDFTDEDIRLALQKRLPAGWKQVYKKIEGLSNLLDLASRPVLLDMIIKTLPQIQDASQINLATLYKIYVRTLLELRWSKDSDNISPEDRLFFVQELAWEMDQTQRQTIPFSEFPERVVKHFDLKDDPERAAFFERDVRTQSYLVRDDEGNYRFAHKSFLEFFVACKMVSALSSSEEDVTKAIAVWKSKLLTPEVRSFLVDMVEDPELLWQMMEATRNMTVVDAGYAGGNAATLLRLKGASFARADLSHTNLVGADLYNSDLTGTDLRNACLRQANIRGCMLVEADVRNVDLMNIRIGEMGSVEAVTFDPSGEMVVSGSADGLVRLWRWATGEQVGQFFGDTFVTSVCFSPDGQSILAGVGMHGHIKRWDSKNGKLIHTFIGHTGPVWDISSCPGQHRIASGAHDGSIRIWDLNSGAQVRVIHKRDRGIWDICYSLDGAYIAAAGGQELGIYDAETGELVWSAPEKTVEFRSVKYSNNHLIAYTTREGKIFLRDAISKQLICEMQAVPVGPNSITFSPVDREMLAIGGSGPGAAIQIWNTQTGKMILARNIGSDGYVGRIHWGLNNHLVIGSSDGIIYVWDVDPNSPTFGQCRRTLEAKMNCKRMRIGGAKGLDVPAPDRKGALRNWFIARGAVE